MIGQAVSHYRIISKIGEGGMGIIYKAQDTKLKREVALKFLPPELTRDQEAKERFIREAQTISGIDHPNICTVYEIDETKDGQIFIAMACYNGRTLKEKLEDCRITIEEAVNITIDVTQGLAKAHKQGIVHRDIKPANIFITNDGVVKILDFGLAKLASQSSLTKTGSTPGTVFYMSPEQAKGVKIDHRTDVWSLGVVLYEMITGKLPFRGEYEQAIIYSILNEKPEKVRSIYGDIPVEIERIIDKALQKEAAKRYQNIQQLENDLKHIVQNLQVSSSKQRALSFYKRNIIKRSALAGLIILFVLSFFILKSVIFKKEVIEKPISLAVISFENQTGNSAYDYLQDAIPNLLITSLEQSPQLQVTTWERLYDLLKQTGKEKIKEIDKETGFELCYLDDVDAIVLGSFIKTGDIFATDIKVLDVTTKRLLKSAASQGTGVESILKHQIDQLSDEISKAIIRSEKQTVYIHQNIMDVTTSSIEAYHYFIRGMEEYYQGSNGASKYFRMALVMDSTFATAYLWLGKTYNSDIAERTRLFMKARQFSRRTTQKEQLYIDAELVPDFKKKIQLYRQIIKKYPKEKYPHYILAEHYAYHQNFKEAINEGLKALELDPYFVLATNSLCYWYMETGNNKKTEEYLKRLAAINPGGALPLMTAANISYIDGKLDAAIEKYKENMEINPGSGSEYYLSLIVACKGDFNQALEWTDKLIDHESPYFMKPGGICMRGYFNCYIGKYNDALRDYEYSYGIFKEWGNLYFQVVNNVLMGFLYLEKEDYEKSRKYLYNYQQFFSDRNKSETLPIYDFTCEPFLGLIDIKQGYIDSARMRLSHLKTTLPNVHVTIRDITNLYYQLLKAEYLLAIDSTDVAIAIGESIKELAPPHYFFSTDRVFFYNLPFLKDILARAYIKKGNIDQAIAEYERMIRFDPASKDRRIMNPKYHYYVAKLYQKKGLKNKAIQHYKQFLNIWKNADEDLPEYIDAKKRLKSLTNDNAI